MNITSMFHAIDTHVLGEGYRIIIQSPFLLRGKDIHEREEMLYRDYQREMKLLLNEPRGHRGMHGCLILPSSVADFQLISFSHASVSAFKYEGLAASLTALLETGNIKQKSTQSYTIETVKGIFELRAIVEQDEVTSIEILNHSAEVMEVTEDYQLISIDHDRCYHIEPLPIHIPDISINHLEALTEAGILKLSLCQRNNIAADGVIFTRKVSDSYYRTVTFEQDGYIRRTAGMDSSIALALAGRQILNAEKSIVNESVFQSKLTFNVVLEQEGIYKFRCRPFITGTHQFVFDKDDPLVNGFLLK